MSKNKRHIRSQEELPDLSSSSVTEETPATAPLASEEPLFQEPVLSLEQVALSCGSKCTPQFKAHHLAGLISFCKSTGLPTSGTQKEMQEVMRRFGYKI